MKISLKFTPITRILVLLTPLADAVFEGNVSSTSPRGACIWRNDLTEGFGVTGLWGLYMEGLFGGILPYAANRSR